ncbi:hypothetical protein DEJ16_12695 [Curtobacterium sp. MCJR17_055]|uniref:hypothetical protein n=1 Tax=unclassified Curtobacterium TaxID=257496 RepID=UPI000D819597|nr:MULTISPECIES: hypothetical protein [unclassified Curtobacterium]PYY34108.1 hypothetical protein DEI87_10120 [Curtobacterium sp. MCBD17_029]PYY53958.1 hypothetical protein DEJ16_12695 [Curtobacterium sp. MCJR17_055]PYY59155.1 hypothetical protein DEJ26_09120 [Curtobacterium sp. MCPF17_015]WIB34797.1 hypothetical protein DEJ15_09465 [Curtobacterium sp. MCJR17_043]
MSIKTFETYTILCDEPGCEADFVEQWSGGEYSGMGSASDLDLTDIDWVEREGKHYCASHADLHHPRPDALPQPENDPTALPPAMFDMDSIGARA